jgi:hypothetical protein
VRLYGVAAGQCEAIHASRTERDPREPLMKRVHPRARSPALRRKPQVRKPLFPVLPHTRREEQVPPDLKENVSV